MKYKYNYVIQKIIKNTFEDFKREKFLKNLK